MVAFGKVGRRSGGVGVEPRRGHQIAGTLVVLGRGGGMPGQGGVELHKGGEAGPGAVGPADRDGPVEAHDRTQSQTLAQPPSRAFRRSISARTEAPRRQVSRK
jgi:hypothetical protein